MHTAPFRWRGSPHTSQFWPKSSPSSHLPMAPYRPRTAIACTVHSTHTHTHLDAASPISPPPPSPHTHLPTPTSALPPPAHPPPPHPPTLLPELLPHPPHPNPGFWGAVAWRAAVTLLALCEGVWGCVQTRCAGGGGGGGAHTPAQSPSQCLGIAHEVYCPPNASAACGAHSCPHPKPPAPPPPHTQFTRLQPPPRPPPPLVWSSQLAPARPAPPVHAAPSPAQQFWPPGCAPAARSALPHAHGGGLQPLRGAGGPPTPHPRGRALPSIAG